MMAILILPALGQDRPDLSVIDRIKTEAFDRSKVMDTLYQITEVRGPRLTASPQFDNAAAWTVSQLREYGLQNVHLEKWGPFGRSWSLEQSSLELLEPSYQRLEAIPLAWSSSTHGDVTGDLVIAPWKISMRDGPKKVREDLDAFKAKWTGKLRGKIVLLSEARAPKPATAAPFTRFTDAQLHDIGNAPDPAVRKQVKSLADLNWPTSPEDVTAFLRSLPASVMDQVYDLSDSIRSERAAFFSKEGAVALLMEDNRAHEGRIFAEQAGPWKAADTQAPPTFVITAEQYDRVARAVERKLPVRVRLNVKAQASSQDVMAANIVGEIPGQEKKDEIVMIGAHFDSWHSGTGTTDNGAGSAVMIEVTRILTSLKLKMDRTVRIALWSGEEQGLLGSKAYVKEHFADPKTMHLTAEHGKISGYFNLDNGSGKIRGVFLQGHEAMRPVFESWLAPFRDMGVSTISIRDTGGTDHLSFDAVGIPGFQFIQDPLDYSTVTHHSNMDTYDHAIPEDLMQASAVIASVVYGAANRKETLPRRPLPAP